MTTANYDPDMTPMLKRLGLTNVYMLQHAELFKVPHWVLIVRLPFQVALLALILWSTWKSPANRSRVDS